jgi:hypothetical protein
MTILLLLASLLQQPPTDAEADTALRTLKDELAKRGIEGRVIAIKEALKTPHEKVIKAIAEPLTKDVETVRIPAAHALAEVDHPVCVEVLVEAIPANLARPEVMNAISAALGTLGWATASGPLNELVKKVGDADVRAILPGVVHAIGEIGSPSSVEGLADFLVRVQGPQRNPWPNEGAIVKAAETALRAITGVDHRRGIDWLEWWKGHQADLLPKAKRIYWSRKTHERTNVSPGEKAPEDSVLVVARLTDVPAAGAAEAKKKKKK